MLDKIVETVKFFSYDGVELVGIYTAPPVETRHAILLNHGLPSDKDEWGFYADMASFMANNGVATFRYDFRFNGESEKGSFSKLTISELINDIESAYWELRKRTDNKLISVVGTSCGGGISVAWANRFNRDIHKLFLMAPVLDYEYEVTGKKRKSTLNNHVVLDNDVLEVLQKTGKLNDDIGYGYQMVNEAHLFNIRDELTKNRSPVHIFHGSSDTIVPFDLTVQSIDGIDGIELISIPDCDHGFSVEGDDDLTAPGTKENHTIVYNGVLKRL